MSSQQDRPDWDEYFMEIAKVVAARSNCSRRHVAAVIVKDNEILAARCILPVTSRTDIDPNLGLRHRSAIGVTEQLDVVAVIVSEETGAISYVVDGQIHHDVTPVELRQFLEQNIK